MAPSRSRTFAAAPGALREVRGWIGEAANLAGLGEETTADVVLAVSEACANAVRHSGSPRFDVSWNAPGDRFDVEVADHGLFQNRMRVAVVGGAGGMGLPLMTALMDAITVEEGRPEDPGTTVRLTKKLPAMTAPAAFAFAPSIPG